MVVSADEEGWGVPAGRELSIMTLRWRATAVRPAHLMVRKRSDQGLGPSERSTTAGRWLGVTAEHDATTCGQSTGPARQSCETTDLGRSMPFIRHRKWLFLPASQPPVDNGGNDGSQKRAGQVDPDVGQIAGHQGRPE